MLIQMAISRSREYDADAASRQVRRLALPADRRPAEARDLVEAHPHGCLARHRAHVHHQAVHRRSFMRLFSTHPSTEDRIARLQAMR